MQFKIALPKGHLLGETSSLLARAGWGLDDYREGTRAYRLKSQTFPDLFAKVFQERDIPIQVAVGNYDLGICGLDWIEELLAKYPASDLVKLRDTGIRQRGAVRGGQCHCWQHRSWTLSRIKETLSAWPVNIRI